MPLVKTKLREEPIEVPDDEVAMLRGAGLLVAVLDDDGEDDSGAPASTPAPAGDQTDTGSEEND